MDRSKFSAREIVRRHHASFVVNGTDRVQVRDWMDQYLPAVLVLVAMVAVELGAGDWIRFTDELTAALIAATGLLAALLFGATITLLEKAMDTDTAGPRPSPEVARTTDRLEELAANTAYASLVSGATTLVLVAAQIVRPLDKILTAIGVAALVLLATSGALVLRRIFAETRIRIDRINSGQSHFDSHR